MREELLFGTAYYPEYMPYDRVSEDMEMMQAAGMNVIRIAESTWSTMEPEEGVFDFSYIDKVLREAEKREMQVIVGTPTYAVPSWLAQKDKNVMVETKEGHAHYGHRQIMDLWSPVFRFYAERVICELLSHTAGHPCVIGFQIDNETKHYNNYGENIQKLFRDYLKEKFKDTDRLNQAFHLAYWSNSIAKWEQFPDMKGCIHGGLSAEFEKFRRKMTSEYLSWQADIVRKYKRKDQFITHNLDFEWKRIGADIAQDGYSYGVQPDINHYEASRHLTVAGTDIYHPTQDELTGAEIAFGGDLIRSLKDDNYIVLENQAQAFKYWTPYPGQLRLHAYSHLASGATGTLYWNWHSIHNGFETYWRGLLSHDLKPNPAYEEACRIGAEWKQIGSRLLHMKKNNQAALIVDNHSLTALQWFPIDKDLTYNDVVRWMYDSLYEMNIECDIVDVNALETSRYRMIIVPALYSASEEVLHKLEAFVKAGGVLVSSFRSFVADEFLTVYHDTLPHILHKCFGMSYNQFTEPGRITVKGTHPQYFAELLKTDDGESLADYEHKYWGKYAAVTRNHYGKGSAYYVGCYLNQELLKTVYEKAASDAGIVNEAMNHRWPVIVRSGRSQNGNKLHYILHYSEEERSIVCDYACAQDILTGESYKKGDLIHLKDWDVVILEECDCESDSCR